jgi:L-ascorbate metabolism protein UlaG (beta-lactamase superfamily)
MLKVTKYVHSCLVVETDDRVAVFDPGTMSETALNVNNLSRVDDIFITHEHPDHFSVDLIKQLVAKFPDAKIISTGSVVGKLKELGISATNSPIDGVSFFYAPHEDTVPLLSPVPEEVGIHYLDMLSDPGDSHSFSETKAILALPVQAPWGSSVNALRLGLELKPRFILPVHDWHWSDDARENMYNRFEQVFGDAGITFFKLETGKPVEIDL